MIPVTQAVILAAGECSRFFPFTRRQHKSDFILLDKPIIHRTVDTLISLGFTHLEIIESPEDDQSLQKSLASYSSKISLRFWTQTKPLGTGNAIIQAQSILENRFLVINPQQINVDEHLKTAQSYPSYLSDSNSLILFSKTTPNPSRYGVFKLDGQKVLGIVEKPQDLTGLSNQRNVGVYLLTKNFVEFMNTLPITDFQLIEALNTYVQNHPAFAIPIESAGLTLKYATDLFLIQRYLLFQAKTSVYIHPEAKIDPSATLNGPLSIEKGSTIGPGCTISASIIGQNTIITNSQISSSIIGNHCQIDKLTTQTQNPDQSLVQITVKNQIVDTALESLGALIGDDSQITGTTTPGQIIPPSSRIS